LGVTTKKQTKAKPKQARVALNADVVDDFLGVCRLARLDYLREIESMMRDRIDSLREEAIRRLRG
jgi:hypothetical protein